MFAAVLLAGGTGPAAAAGAAPEGLRSLGAWTGALAGLHLGPDQQLLLDTQHWHVACRTDKPACAKPQAQARGGRLVAWAVATADEGKAARQWVLQGPAGDPGPRGVTLPLLRRPARAGGPVLHWPALRAAQPPGPEDVAALPGQALLRVQALGTDAPLRLARQDAQGQAVLAPAPEGLLPDGAQPERVGVANGRWWVAGESRGSGGERQAWLGLAMPVQHWHWPAQADAGLQHELWVDGVTAQGPLLWVAGRRVQLQRSTLEPTPPPPTAWVARLDPAAPTGTVPAPQPVPLPAGTVRWLGWLPGAAQPTVCAAVGPSAAAASQLHCLAMQGQAWQAWPRSLPLPAGARVQALQADAQGQVWLALLARGRTELAHWSAP